MCGPPAWQLVSSAGADGVSGGALPWRPQPARRRAERLPVSRANSDGRPGRGPRRARAAGGGGERQMDRGNSGKEGTSSREAESGVWIRPRGPRCRQSVFGAVRRPSGSLRRRGCTAAGSTEARGRRPTRRPRASKFVARRGAARSWRGALAAGQGGRRGAGSRLGRRPSPPPGRAAGGAWRPHGRSGPPACARSSRRSARRCRALRKGGASLASAASIAGSSSNFTLGNLASIGARRHERQGRGRAAEQPGRPGAEA
ncbi:unnamed protein product, partial [Prorocentrum cordatum]